MIIKRSAQLKLLEEQYNAQGNNLVILYGRKGMGKTTLIREFLKSKQSVFYYEGTECDASLQQLFMSFRLHGTSLENDEADSSPFSKFTGNGQKLIIVLDEFHYIIKNNPGFPEAFKLLESGQNSVMFILCSSSIRWVENEMLQSLGAYVSYITAYLKLKELSFVDFVNRFPESSVSTCIHINAILGGVPEYLDEWQEKVSVSDNIKNLLLDKNSRLLMATQQFLKLELREPAVYNTILYLLADGNRKLNDLYEKTGYSRAKIIVYLKNLMQLDLVEKIVPINDTGKENVLKGLYRIKDNFFSFWYRFVFPNLSDIMLGKSAMVYEEKLAPELDLYLQEYFADVCTEYLKLMNQHGKLPGSFIWWDRWYGKNGTIDILSEGENKEALIGKCLWQEEPADITDYETVTALTQQAGKQPDYCYIFSKNGFTDALKSIADDKGNVFLVGLDEL
jgi:AAA+ ATPase superfamily predicted ATPase